MADSPRANPKTDEPYTPLPAVLVLTALASIGTGVIWHGIAFVAKHDYGFEKQRTLVMFIVMGAIYVIGALTAGRLTRAVESRLSARALLALILLVEATVSVLPIILDAEWVLWLAAGINSLLAAFFWPTVESYVTAGCHGDQMRSAIGWFNIVWTGAVVAAMLMMAPVVEHAARLAIVGAGVGHLLGLIPLCWFRSAPIEHDEASWRTAVGPEYPMLLRSVRILLPLSYVLSAAMSPLMPYLFHRLDLTEFWETPLVATWMTVRIFAVTAMWYLGFWHGRWGTLLLGGVSMTGGFALVVLGPALWVVLVGFVAFGVGLGVVYYAALYYAMSVGRAQIDAGGMHESLIGLGYTIGPAAGLVGLACSGNASGTGLQINEGVGVVAVVWVLIAVGAVFAVRPYLRARRLRRRLVGDGEG